MSGGGPSNEHCYSSGLLLHYLLTGDPLSREAAIGLAEWVLAMDDGRRAKWPLPWLSAAPTGGRQRHGVGRLSRARPRARQTP